MIGKDAFPSTHRQVFDAMPGAGHTLVVSGIGNGETLPPSAWPALTGERFDDHSRRSRTLLRADYSLAEFAAAYAQSPIAEQNAARLSRSGGKSSVDLLISDTGRILSRVAARERLPTDDKSAERVYTLLEVMLSRVDWLPERTSSDVVWLEEAGQQFDDLQADTSHLLSLLLSTSRQKDPLQMILPQWASSSNKKWTFPGFMCEQRFFGEILQFDCLDTLFTCQGLCIAIGLLFSECGQAIGLCEPGGKFCWCVCYIPCFTWRKIIILLVIAIVIIAIAQGWGAAVIQWIRSNPELWEKLMEVLRRLWRLVHPELSPIPTQLTSMSLALGQDDAINSANLLAQAVQALVTSVPWKMAVSGSVILNHLRVGAVLGGDLVTRNSEVGHVGLPLSIDAGRDTKNKVQSETCCQCKKKN